MTARDVTVVGGGLVGMLTALRLARSGLSVTVLDHEFPGAGSTGAAMGHLVVMDDSDAQLALCAWSRSQWDALVATLPHAAEYQPTGTLWLAASEAELAAAVAKAAVFKEHGVAAEVLDERSLMAVEPHLRRDLAGALRVPGDGICYPPGIIRALLVDAAAASVQIVCQRAIALKPGVVVCADGSRISTGSVVVAAGAQSAELVPDLPVVPRRGHLVITDGGPDLVRHQLVELGYLHTAHTLGGASVAFNVQPRRDGQVLIGSSRELVGFAPQINRDLVARMVGRAIAFLPALGRRTICRTWVGFRPATPDALPLIGRWPAIPGVWIATGHEGLGITMAPGTADLIAADLLGGKPPVDPAPYRPDRAMPLATAA